MNDNNGRMPLAEVRFPKLTSKQRKFAVNPGYMSYYNDDFAEIEDERDILGIYQFEIQYLKSLIIIANIIHITNNFSFYQNNQCKRRKASKRRRKK